MRYILRQYIFLLLLISCLVLPVSAEQEIFVIDHADLLTDAEEMTLQETISDLRWIYEMDIVILTEQSLNGNRPQDHADDYYDFNGYAEDGLLFLLSMEERDWYISTCGVARYALTDYGIQQVGETAVPYLAEGSYFEAFEVFLAALPEYFDAYLAGSSMDGYADYSGDYYHGDQEEILYYEEPFTPSLFVAVLIGLVAAAISVLVMRLSMNTRKPQKNATVYMKQHSYALTQHRDLFLYSNVSKVRRQQNNNSSGGGSSVHHSSSGRSHGGGGGKF